MAALPSWGSPVPCLCCPSPPLWPPQVGLEVPRLLRHPGGLLGGGWPRSLFSVADGPWTHPRKARLLFGGASRDQPRFPVMRGITSRTLGGSRRGRGNSAVLFGALLRASCRLSPSSGERSPGCVGERPAASLGLSWLQDGLWDGVALRFLAGPSRRASGHKPRPRDRIRHTGGASSASATGQSSGWRRLPETFPPREAASLPSRDRCEPGGPPGEEDTTPSLSSFLVLRFQPAPRRRRSDGPAVALEACGGRSRELRRSSGTACRPVQEARPLEQGKGRLLRVAWLKRAPGLDFQAVVVAGLVSGRGRRRGLPGQRLASLAAAPGTVLVQKELCFGCWKLTVVGVPWGLGGRQG